MRAVFLGTPEAAVPSLLALAAIADVRMVLTRPDRPAGRSRRLQPPPVKTAATEIGLAVEQPAAAAELAAVIGALGEIDVGVVVAFGTILRPEILALPRAGFLNVHFSLLPRWRGAAPVERALMAGDTVTGVTIMAMDPGLDTGPVVATRAIDIGPGETGGDLTDRLAVLGAELVTETVAEWVTGEVGTRPQPDDGITYAHKLSADDRRLTAAMVRREFVDTVRALAPHPAAQLEIEGADHKILAVAPVDDPVAPGEWAVREGTPLLGLADGAVSVELIQPPGKRPMAGGAWLRGRPLPPG